MWLLGLSRNKWSGLVFEGRLRCLLTCCCCSRVSELTAKPMIFTQALRASESARRTLPGKAVLLLRLLCPSVSFRVLFRCTH